MSTGTSELIRNNGHTLPLHAWAVRPTVVGSCVELPPRPGLIPEQPRSENPVRDSAPEQPAAEERPELDQAGESSDETAPAEVEDEATEQPVKRRGWFQRTFFPTSDELAEQAREATKIRRLDTDPDVVAFRIEKTNRLVDRGVMIAVLFGMAFCAANVAAFALDLFKAHYAKPDEAYLVATGTGPLWWAAWLVDPAFSVLVMTILKAEQLTSRFGVSTGRAVMGVGIFAFAATYVMNTWKAWEDVLGSGGTKGWDGVVLHSVVPGLVLAAVVVAPLLRKALANCVERAYEQQIKRREREAAAPREAIAAPAKATATTSTKTLAKPKAKTRKSLSPAEIRERNLRIAREAGARTATEIRDALKAAGVALPSSPSTLDNYAKALRTN